MKTIDIAPNKITFSKAISRPKTQVSSVNATGTDKIDAPTNICIMSRRLSSTFKGETAWLMILPVLSTIGMTLCK